MSISRDDPQAPSASLDQIRALWDAIHETAICAWNLLDGTQDDASGVDQADWNALSSAMTAMAALVPKDEQPFSPSYAVPYLRNIATRPASPAPAASAVMSEWCFDMNAAPQDGKRILLWHIGHWIHPVIGYRAPFFAGEERSCWREHGSRARIYAVDCWCHIPTPPSERPE
jgi:hypothetical protein